MRYYSKLGIKVWCMIKFVLRICCLLLLSAGLKAHGMESPGRDFEKADKLKEQIFPGKILVDSSDGSTRIDYASAFVLGLPGQQQSRSVLSCAHIANQARSKDSACKFWYEDYLGKVLPVEMVFPLTTDLVIDQRNDVAVFRLYQPVSCNPQVEITRETPKEVSIATISHGWVPHSDTYTLENTDGKRPVYFEGKYTYLKSDLSQKFLADRVVQISTHLRPEKRCLYLGKSNSPPQTCLSDSGSPWFLQDTTSLVAVTSCISSVSTTDMAFCAKQTPIHTSDFSFLGLDRTCEVFKLEKETPFENTLTELPHLREKIYGLIK